MTVIALTLEEGKQVFVNPDRIGFFQRDGSATLVYLDPMVTLRVQEEPDFILLQLSTLG